MTLKIHSIAIEIYLSIVERNPTHKHLSYIENTGGCSDGIQGEYPKINNIFVLQHCMHVNGVKLNYSVCNSLL